MHDHKIPLIPKKEVVQWHQPVQHVVEGMSFWTFSDRFQKSSLFVSETRIFMPTQAY